jgi:hypothetical protein
MHLPVMAFALTPKPVNHFINGYLKRSNVMQKQSDTPINLEKTSESILVQQFSAVLDELTRLQKKICEAKTSHEYFPTLTPKTTPLPPIISLGPAGIGHAYQNEWPQNSDSNLDS